jgi:hypothetical protein
MTIWNDTMYFIYLDLVQKLFACFHFTHCITNRIECMQMKWKQHEDNLQRDPTFDLYWKEFWHLFVSFLNQIEIWILKLKVSFLFKIFYLD